MMSGIFKGFSEHDIKKMKIGEVSAGANDGQIAFVKKANFQNKRNSNIAKKMSPGEDTEVTVCPIPEGAKLSLSSQITTVDNTESLEFNIEDRTTLNNDVISNAYVSTENNNIHNENGNNFDSKYEAHTMENIENCGSEKPPINLEEFQIKQKLMEEQNRRRREMIVKALADRTKQTAEEALRLEKIKKEFQTLDTRLSVDVCILRKQIDQASLAYAEAEKHYNKLESEFLTAKINLHKEREKKEQLTEHLCAIIAHNEVRKAKKLEDLMEQLSSEPCKKTVIDGVCEQTGKMLELDENGEVIKNDDDD